MKSTFFASALLLGTMASPAMAQGTDVSPAKGGPVMLTAVQMDAVTAGQCNRNLVAACDVVDVGNVQVAVPVNAAAAVAVLGGAVATADQTGNIEQRN